jgi:signal transduction histidine kinase
LTASLPDGESLRDISHSLRNPVAGIRTTAQVLLDRLNRRDDLPASWAELVNRIVNETYNMESAINELEKNIQPSGSPEAED